MKQFSIAFYNLENFYDKSIDENSFIVGNKSKWNETRYDLKKNIIGKILYNIGRAETGESPFLIGVCEAENDKVLIDLVQTTDLSNENYDVILYDSLDERKINVGLLYKKDKVEILNSKPIRIVFNDSHGNRSYTRDILQIEAKVSNEILHIFVIHLPSKRDGILNLHKRKMILEHLKSNIEKLQKDNANIVLMGDFNDTPTNENLREILSTRANKNEVETSDLYNPFVKMMNYETGTIVYKDQWLIFDQFLFSKNLIKNENNFHLESTKIFNTKTFTNNELNNNSYPTPTFRGKKYFGGSSDHFPIYSIINYKFAE